MVRKTFSPRIRARVFRPRRKAQCAHTGVTPTQYGNGITANNIPQCVSGQCGEVIEGNEQLKPETAITWSLGLTFTPVALPGFNASIDYYHIRLENEIGNYPFATIFNGCLLDDNPIYCSQIVRNKETGALTGATVAGGGYIVQKDFNLGLSIVSGFDVIMNYRVQPADRLGIHQHSSEWCVPATRYDYTVPGFGELRLRRSFRIELRKRLGESALAAQSTLDVGDAVECALVGAMAFHRPHELRQQFHEPVAGRGGGSRNNPHL
jgi:hypothetical protein